MITIRDYVVTLAFFILFVRADGQTVKKTASPISLTSSESMIVWEAEWANRVTGTYRLYPDDGCSGTGALWSPEGTGRQNGVHISTEGNNPTIDMGVADYYFNVPRSGRYRIYMRVWALDCCGNSCWVGVDHFSSTRMTYFPGGRSGRLGSSNYSNWPKSYYKRWIWATDETANHYLKKGTHQMRIQVREDGFGIDQIALLPLSSRTPRGKLTPTQIPGASGLPGNLSFSTTQPTTSQSQRPTPFDVFFSMGDPVLSDAPLRTTGYAWVRLNADKATDVTLNLSTQTGRIKPGVSLSCSLTPSAPLIKIPLEFEWPEGSERRSYPVTITGSSTQWPNVIITRSQSLTHSFDWFISDPCTLSTAYRIFSSVAKVSSTSVSALPQKERWQTLRWTRALPRRHYNQQGTVEIGKMHGPERHKAVVAATWITVKKPGRVNVYGAGDDTLILYRGQRMIMYDNLERPLTDTIRPRNIYFPAGKHLLIAIITQRHSWWQFHLEFRQANGMPSANIIGHEWK